MNFLLMKVWITGEREVYRLTWLTDTQIIVRALYISWYVKDILLICIFIDKILVWLHYICCSISVQYRYWIIALSIACISNNMTTLEIYYTTFVLKALQKNKTVRMYYTLDHSVVWVGLFLGLITNRGTWSYLEKNFNRCV